MNPETPVVAEFVTVGKFAALVNRLPPKNRRVVEIFKGPPARVVPFRLPTCIWFTVRVEGISTLVVVIVAAGA